MWWQPLQFQDRHALHLWPRLTLPCWPPAPRGAGSRMGVMPQSCSMATGMEDAHHSLWRLKVHLLNSIRGVKGLDPNPLWESGLVHSCCGNKMI